MNTVGSYAELLSLINQPEIFERVSPSGTIYQIEMEVFFDDNSKRSTLRVSGAIDDSTTFVTAAVPMKLVGIGTTPGPTFMPLRSYGIPRMLVRFEPLQHAQQLVGLERGKRVS